MISTIDRLTRKKSANAGGPRFVAADCLSRIIPVSSHLCVSTLITLLLVLPISAFCEEDAGKSGVGPTKVSLPDGPGSIEGLGSAFEPQLNSGTASFQVDVKVPSGTAGLQPSVSLAYNSGSGTEQ